MKLRKLMTPLVLTASFAFGLVFWMIPAQDNVTLGQTVIGNGDADNTLSTGITEFNGHFYVAIENPNDGAEIWYTDSDMTWTPVITGG